MPIGNLTSQFWGNVYLNEVDQFAKRRLGCRSYLRYVDDVLILGESAEQLREWRDHIAGFLRAHLRLELRAGMGTPVPVGEGLDFVGWKTWWSHRLPRRRTLRNLDRCLDRFERRWIRPAFSGLARRIEVPRGRVDAVSARAPLTSTATRGGDLEPVLASYGGHLRHGASWRDWSRARQRWPWLPLLFERSGWQARWRWPARDGARRMSFRVRYRRLLRRAPRDCLLFVRVGRFVEFYGPQRVLAQRVLGLRPVPLARAGYALTCGFPPFLAVRFVERALHAGVAIALCIRSPSPSSILFPWRPGWRSEET